MTPEVLAELAITYLVRFIANRIESAAERDATERLVLEKLAFRREAQALLNARER